MIIKDCQNCFSLLELDNLYYCKHARNQKLKPIFPQDHKKVLISDIPKCKFFEEVKK